MVTTIWNHRLHKINDERIGSGIGRMRDEKLVKKELIIFVGPQKTGKYVIHNPERGRDCCVFDEGGEIIGDSTGYPSRGVLEIGG
jgi:hypothetical protein